MAAGPRDVDSDPHNGFFSMMHRDNHLAIFKRKSNSSSMDFNITSHKRWV